MKRIALLLCLAAMAAACPKNTGVSVTGSDDERMDQLSSHLEELRTTAQARELKCDEWCSMKSKVCDISTTVCDVAGRKTDRADFQQKCVTSQEDCAKFSDSCSTCSK